MLFSAFWHEISPHQGLGVRISLTSQESQRVKSSDPVKPQLNILPKLSVAIYGPTSSLISAELVFAIFGCLLTCVSAT